MAVMNGRKVPWAVLTVLAGMAAGPVLANDPPVADVQWAQTILKEKGLNIGGRANGQMTAQTRSALSQYQKSVGLPATGTLDSATIAKLMGERKASATVGNLAAQKPGSTPRLTEREATPRAATRAGDVRTQGGGDVMLGPIVREAPAGVTVPPATGVAPGGTQRYTPPAAAPGTPAQGGSRAVADAGPAMTAAPRAAVTATTADGKEVPTTLLSKGDEEGINLPGWLRYAVMGVLAATLGFVGFGWWRSGRARPPGYGPAAVDDDGDLRSTTRREPSFTRSRDELMAGPRLGAARGRSR